MPITVVVWESATLMAMATKILSLPPRNVEWEHISAMGISRFVTFPLPVEFASTMRASTRVSWLPISRAMDISTCMSVDVISPTVSSSMMARGTSQMFHPRRRYHSVGFLPKLLCSIMIGMAISTSTSSIAVSRAGRDISILDFAISSSAMTAVVHLRMSLQRQALTTRAMA